MCHTIRFAIWLKSKINIEIWLKINEPIRPAWINNFGQILDVSITSPNWNAREKIMNEIQNWCNCSFPRTDTIYRLKSLHIRYPPPSPHRRPHLNRSILLKLHPTISEIKSFLISHGSRLNNWIRRTTNDQNATEPNWKRKKKTQTP